MNRFQEALSVMIRRFLCVMAVLIFQQICLIPADALASGGLVINEFMIANTVITDEDGDTPDWIELYNASSEVIDLGEYYLSDDPREKTKWRFPSYDLDPGAYTVIYASGKDRVPPPYFHTNFKLSADDGNLVLTHFYGTVEDQVAFGDIPRNLSYGRHPQTGEWDYCSDVTPGEANATPLTDVVKFSVEGGFFSGPVTVALSGETEDTQIYYTTNGTTATTASARYTGPITISSTKTIRAVALRPGYAVSAPAGHTYLINFDAKGLPVLSITTEEKNLWDPMVGIFPDEGDTGDLPPNMQPKERRPIHVDYFTDSGDLAFAQDAQIQVVGNSSRKEMMRPFKITANEEVDPMHSRFQYQVLKKNIQEFRHLQVRNNNQDGVKQVAYDPAYRLTFLRNTLMADLCRPLKYFDFRDDGGAVIILINGKNYGFGNIGEKRDNSMIEQNYPTIDDDDVDMIVLKDSDFEGWYYRPDMQVGVADFFGIGIAEYEEVSAGARAVDDNKGLSDFLDLMGYIKGSDLSNENNYAYVAQRLHINSFLTAMAAQIIAGNIDFFTNNIGFWREHKAGEEPGPFYTTNYDFDATFGLTGSASRDTLDFAYNYLFVLKSLLNNDTFRQAFIRRFDQLLNGTFHADSAVPVAEDLRDRIEPWVEFHLNKWSEGRTSKGQWLQNVANLIKFLQSRPAYVRDDVEALFGLPESSAMTFDIQPSGGGAVYMDILSEDVEISSGMYFNGIPMTLIARAAEGYRFEGFEINGQVMEDSSIEMIPSGEMTVTVRFAQDPNAPAGEVVINEIVTGGKKKYFDVEGNDVDWIELYNTTDRVIDLSGKYLSDDTGELMKWQFPDGTRIASGKFLLILASGKDKIDEAGLMHTNFKISAGESDPVMLVDDNGIDILDEITSDQIQSIADDHSGGRYADGSSTFVSMPSATPGLANIYTPPAEPGVLVSPVKGATLESSDVDFEWSSGNRVEMYQLNIGRGISIFTRRDASDFLFSQQTTDLGLLAEGLPMDGRDVYVKLWSYIDGVWKGGTVLTYHTVLQETQQAVTESLPVVDDDTAAASRADQDVSDDSAAQTSLAAADAGETVLAVEISSDQDSEPADDQPEETSFQVESSEEDAPETMADAAEEASEEASEESSESEETISAESSQEAAAQEQEPAATADLSASAAGLITSPSSGGVLDASNPLVTWSPAVNADAYFLDAASSWELLLTRGGGDIFSQETGAATSVSLYGASLPSTGLYLRLWTQVDGVWQAGGIVVCLVR